MGKCHYWTDEALLALQSASTFAEVGALMLEMVHRFPERAHGSIIQVCGPISTGGFNSSKMNLFIFSSAIRRMRGGGKYVLDQMPLEDEICRLVAQWRTAPGNSGYCWPVLEEVYLPLFESGLVGTLLFLPGWESSVGSCWERAQGLSRHMHLLPYPKDTYDEILVAHGMSPR